MSKQVQVVFAVALGAVLLAVGFFVGRWFPVHHYEQFGKGPLLYDTTTGKICTTVQDTAVQDPTLPKGFKLNTPSSSSDSGLRSFVEGIPGASYPVCGK